MKICFNIVEDREFDPTPAHIIITDEIKSEEKNIYVVYIPTTPPRYPQVRKRLTQKMIKQGINSGIYYLCSLDYTLAGGLRDGIVEEIKKYLDDKNIQLPRV